MNILELHAFQYVQQDRWYASVLTTSSILNGMERGIHVFINAGNCLHT